MTWKQIYSTDFTNFDRGDWNNRYIWSRDEVINNELQHYVDWETEDGWSPFSIENGILSITARRTPPGQLEASNNQPYQSGLLTSRHHYSQQYGRIEARIKVPAGQGLWPAFWLLPEFKQWPKGVSILPEIDIMEVLGHDTKKLHMTIHTNQEKQKNQYGLGLNLAEPLSDDFHTYGVEWDTERITWLLDDDSKFTWQLPTDHHGPKHFLLNLAVGGNWPGSPDGSTQFPATMQIQWVKGWQKVEKPIERLRKTTTLALALDEKTLIWGILLGAWKINIFRNGEWYDTLEDPMAHGYSVTEPGEYQIEYLGSEFEFWGKSNSIFVE